MKNNQLAKITERHRVSTSTASKVLRHCRGISTEIREMILETHNTGFIPSEQDTDLYIMLPENPSFYWSKISRLIISNFSSTLRIKWNYFSKVSDEKTVEKYMEEAIHLHSKAILMAARISDQQIITKFEDLFPECTVFSLNEPTQITNSFYIGSDYENDNALLATQIKKDLGEAPKLLIFPGPPFRTEHFLKLFNHKNCWVSKIPTEEKALAAIMARHILENTQLHTIDAVVCLTGKTEWASLAIQKCKLSLPCYGFDLQQSEYNTYPNIKASVNQDLEKISTEAVKIVSCFLKEKMFPDKNTFIPSELIVPQPENA